MGGEGTPCNLTPRDRASVLLMSVVVEKAFFSFFFKQVLHDPPYQDSLPDDPRAPESSLVLGHGPGQGADS